MSKHALEVAKLAKKGVSKRQIAKRLNISRSSVRRLLEPMAEPRP